MSERESEQEEDTPSNRSLALARRFGSTLATWLQDASSDAVAAVLRSADSSVLRTTLSDLGLRRRWLQLRYKKDSHVLIAPATQLALSRQRQVDKNFLASRLIFTWWGREAERFCASALPNVAVAQWPLPYRFSEVVASIREEGVSVEQLAGPVRSSSLLEPLQVLFLALASAGVERWSRQQLTSALRASPEGGPSPGGTPAWIEVRAKPRNTEHLQTSQDLVGEGAVVAQLMSLFGLCHTENDSATAALEAGDYDALEASTKRLQELQAAIAKVVSGIDARAFAAGIVPVECPKAAYSDVVAAKEYVDELERRFEAARERQNRQFRLSVEMAAERFRRCGLDVPAELEEAADRATLEAAVKAHEPTLAVEEAFVSMSSWPDDPTVQFRALGPAERLDVFERLLALPASDRSVRCLLHWAALDGHAMNANVSRALGICDRLVAVALTEFAFGPPSAFWATYGGLAGPKAADRLLGGDLGSLIADGVEAGVIDLTSVQALPGFDQAELPWFLKKAVALGRLASAPQDTPLRELATLALAVELDAQVVSEVVARLLLGNHCSAAVALALVASRGGLGPVETPALRLAAADVLVRAVAEGGAEQRDLVRRVLEQDWEWLAESPTTTVALLFLMSETRAERPTAEIRYYATEAVREIAATRPALVQRWLLDRRLPGVMSDDTVPTDAEWETARQALVNFDHEVQRPSAYSAWEPAVEYQRRVNRRLLETLASIDASVGARTVEPSAWLQDASGAPPALPKVEGRARMNMIAYLESQATRLAVLASFKALLGSERGLRESLSCQREPLDQSLDQERASVGAPGVLATIYRIAQEEVSR